MVTGKESRLSNNHPYLMALYTEMHFVQQFKFNSYSTNAYSVSPVNRIVFYVGMNMLQKTEPACGNNILEINIF